MAKPKTQQVCDLLDQHPPYALTVRQIVNRVRGLTANEVYSMRHRGYLDFSGGRPVKVRLARRPKRRRKPPCTVRVVAEEGARLPEYRSDQAAGCDLRVSPSMHTPWRLFPKQVITVPTGLRVQIPEGFEGQIRPRSGLAANHCVTVLNAPGTIDSDYRGEIKVILINLGYTDFEIRKGMRIAQLVIAPVTQAQFVPVADLEEMERGSTEK